MYEEAESLIVGLNSVHQLVTNICCLSFGAAQAGFFTGLHYIQLLNPLLIKWLTSAALEQFFSAFTSKIFFIVSLNTPSQCSSVQKNPLSNYYEQKKTTFSNDSQLYCDFMRDSNPWLGSYYDFLWEEKSTLQVIHCDCSPLLAEYEENNSVSRNSPAGVRWLSHHGDRRVLPINSSHGDEMLYFPGGWDRELWPSTLLLIDPLSKIPNAESSDYSEKQKINHGRESSVDPVRFRRNPLYIIT